ncbi:hypothetical protein, partial [Clostridium tagluense]|uniref:hypothetical protein n=1 Tax=Clostridium tagluense TaxID=360422 RepID=UPI001C6E7883
YVLECLRKSFYLKPIYPLNLLHFKIHASALALKLTENLGQAPEYITEISPVVGLNAGIVAIAVSFISC